MADKADAWMFAGNYASESEIVVETRTATAELGADPISPDAGAALRILAAATGAHTVLEVGTGTGMSGLWLLGGMPAGGVPTSVDSEAEFHQRARGVFVVAGVLTQRTCPIADHTPDVLPRMTARGYDMMAFDTDITETLEYLDHAMRILRPGGVIVFVHVLWHGQAVDSACHDGETIVCHEVVRLFADSPNFIPVILPVGDRLVVAVRR